MDKTTLRLKEHAANARTHKGFIGGSIAGFIAGFTSLIGEGGVSLFTVGLLLAGAVLGEVAERLFRFVYTAPRTTIRDLNTQLAVYKELPKFKVDIAGDPSYGSHQNQIVILLSVRVTCEVRSGSPLDFMAWIENEEGVTVHIEPFTKWVTLKMPDGPDVSHDDLISAKAAYIHETETVDGYFVGVIPRGAWDGAAKLQARVQCYNYKTQVFISPRKEITREGELERVTTSNA